MERNEVFSIKVPNGNTVKAVIVQKISEECVGRIPIVDDNDNDTGTKTGYNVLYLAYSQNRLFSCHQFVEDYIINGQTTRVLTNDTVEYVEELVSFCTIPELDTILINNK